MSGGWKFSVLSDAYRLRINLPGKTIEYFLIMHRKTFIKLSSSFAAAPLLSPLSGLAQQARLQNWAGNLTFSTSNVFYPKTVSEVQELVKKSDKLRGLGTRHCFNDIADSRYNLISSNSLNNILSLDAVNNTVTVEAGIKY
jgi:alditol oxidase